MARTTINTQVIPDGTIVSADLSYPLTDFSSTGIDDNATSTAITIDSSENVGVGEPSPDSAFHVNSGIANNTAFFESTDNGAIVSIADNAGSIQLRAIDNGEFVVQVGGDGATTGTNSTEAMRIDSSGKVGIGTDNPAVELDVASAAPQVRLTDTDGGYCEVTNVSGHLLLQADKGNTQSGSYMRFDVDNTERMRIDSSGNVGIGTTSPTYTLDTQSSNSNWAARVLNTSSTNGNGLLVRSDSTNDPITFGVFGNGAYRMVVKADGDVGIGTVTPVSNLEVVGGSSSNVTIRGTSGAGADTDAILDLTARGSGNQFRNTEIRSIGANASGGILTFSTDNTSAALTERMRIDSSGNVGIGTTSPNALLHVSSAGNGEIEVERVSGALINIQAQAGVGVIGTDSNHGLRLKTNGAVRATITASGSVGIGTTSPADELEIEGVDPAIRLDDTSAGGYARLEATNGSMVYESDQGNSVANSTHIFKVDGTERMRIDSSGQVLILGNGGTTTNSLDLTYNGTSGQANIQADSSGGSTFLTFGTSLSGTVSERMRIDSSGNVGIGTTSPANSLDINTGSTSRVRCIDGSYNLTTGVWSSAPRLSFGTPSSGNAQIDYHATANTLALTVNNSAGIVSFATNSTERMRIASNGRVGIGTTSPSARFHLLDTSSQMAILGSTSASTYVQFRSSTTTTRGYIGNGSGLVTDANNSDFIFRSQGDAVIAAGGSGERMRITSNGSLLLNSTSQSNYGQTSGSGNLTWRADNGSTGGSLIVTNNADRGWALAYFNKFAWNSGDDSRLINWYTNGTSIGSVTTNGSTVTYGGTSDYRRKQNVVTLSNAIDRVKQLNPIRFEWISDITPGTFDGFLAHEVQEVVPESVEGIKDAVNEEGEIIPQSMDPGKLVPLLTAALQEAIARIEALESA